MDGQTQKRSSWFYRIFRSRKGLIFFVAALIVVIASGVTLILILSHSSIESPKEIIKKPAPPPAPKKYYSPLTGAVVPDEATTKRPVTAVMIENSPDARPQSGIKDGGVVFETIAEAGITRFVILYQEAQPSLIGPVRSVRPYYVEWAAGFDASMAHIGGSARALQMIRSGSYGVDLDQFFNAGTYWRATDRDAPHNVYTDFAHLNALNQAKGHTSSTFSSWPRKDEKAVNKPDATEIDMPISSSLYNVHYGYDRGSNSYVRYLAGANHRDREAGQIQPKVVIALKIPITSGFEDGTREQINTIGSGEADIFQDGTVIKATWHKTAAKANLTFTGPDGKDVALDRGQTWITALDPSKDVSWH